MNLLAVSVCFLTFFSASTYCHCDATPVTGLLSFTAKKIAGGCVSGAKKLASCALEKSRTSSDEEVENNGTEVRNFTMDKGKRCKLCYVIVNWFNHRVRCSNITQQNAFTLYKDFCKIIFAEPANQTTHHLICSSRESSQKSAHQKPTVKELMADDLDAELQKGHNVKAMQPKWIAKRSVSAMIDTASDNVVAVIRNEAHAVTQLGKDLWKMGIQCPICTVAIEYVIYTILVQTGGIAIVSLIDPCFILPPPLSHGCNAFLASGIGHLASVGLFRVLLTDPIGTTICKWIRLCKKKNITEHYWSQKFEKKRTGEDGQLICRK